MRQFYQNIVSKIKETRKARVLHKVLNICLFFPFSKAKLEFNKLLGPKTQHLEFGFGRGDTHQKPSIFLLPYIESSKYRWWWGNGYESCWCLGGSGKGCTSSLAPQPDLLAAVVVRHYLLPELTANTINSQLCRKIAGWTIPENWKCRLKHRVPYQNNCTYKLNNWGPDPISTLKKIQIFKNMLF